MMRVCPLKPLRSKLLIALFFTMLAVPIQPAPAATAQDVDKAIAAGKKYLYWEMKKGLNWETVEAPPADGGPRWSTEGGQWGGRTALSVYALLAAGEDAQDPKLAPAIKWLKTAKIVGTYALSMRCQVWLMLPHTPEIKALAKADAERLHGGYNNNGTAKFLYGYLSNKREINNVDHSVSQFGVLSMWACAQIGVEIDTSYWSQVEKRWTYDQKPDGGWMYSDKAVPPDHPGEQASMTAAGVATLFITQDYVHQNDGIGCSGNIQNKNIDLGLKWMADHTDSWAPEQSFGGVLIPGYTLYGLERIGVASGLKYIGNVDWYQYGADWCLQHQSKATGSFSGDYNPQNTALCLLFLARGRAPVVINKIQYDNNSGPDKGKPGPWNQRPRDVANFARWMGVQTERDINWQITNLDVSEDELHDAPFLYLSGNKELTLKPEQAEKLRQFILHGGMVLFNSDCGFSNVTNPFTTSIIKLGKQLFPEYEFRSLPDTHPIFTSEQYPPNRWKRKVVLRGLSNGVRELMVMMPNDPAKSWQLQETGGIGHEEAFQATDDLILYGTDKTNLRVKGQSFLIKPDPAVTATDTVKIARLKYDRNWNPEPGGWDRLTALMHNQAKVDVTVETVELNDQPITGYKIAHLTGTTALSFSAAQQQQLKNFVQNGGTLIVDCAGGSSDFAQSIEPLLGKLFPAGLNDPLPPTHPIFQLGVPKAPIHYRTYAKLILGNVRTPMVKTVQLNGRDAVYYSRYDLSAGMVGQPIDGIVGYDPDSSSEIMSGIILNTLGKK